MSTRVIPVDFDAHRDDIVTAGWDRWIVGLAGEQDIPRTTMDRLQSHHPGRRGRIAPIGNIHLHIEGLTADRILLNRGQPIDGNGRRLGGCLPWG